MHLHKCLLSIKDFEQVLYSTESLFDYCRFWDFDRGDNYILGIQQHVLPVAKEVVTSISYNSDKGK